MLLDELQTLIETLQDRITKHAPALRQSEALTRYALIDPLLRELGWDTSDPSQVLVEYKVGKERADYALIGDDGKPHVIVEAKKLGEPLSDHITQLVNYCIQDGIAHCVLTDGRHWELYETFRPVPLNDKRVVTLDLEDASAKTCLNALALWRPSVAEGHVRVGVTPVVPTEPIESSTPVKPSPPSAPDDSPTPKVLSTETDTNSGWVPLSALKAKRGDKPRELRLPSGKTHQVSLWANLAMEAVRWLVDNGKLTEKDIPISAGPQRYRVAVKPVHKNGRKFSLVRQVNGFYLETAFNAPSHVVNLRTIITHVGQNPADFAVRLAN